MPNWVTNTVKIVGSEEAIDNLEEHKLSFNHFVPRPESEEENWYEWNCENWGTKWDVDEDEVSIDRMSEEVINFDFLTAWSPPINFLKNLAKLYEKIYIECNYIEESMGFKGFVIITKNNNQINVKEFTWSPPCTVESIEDINVEITESQIESIYIEPNNSNNSQINIKI